MGPSSRPPGSRKAWRPLPNPALAVCYRGRHSTRGGQDQWGQGVAAVPGAASGQCHFSLQDTWRGQPRLVSSFILLYVGPFVLWQQNLSLLWLNPQPRCLWGHQTRTDRWATLAKGSHLPLSPGGTLPLQALSASEGAQPLSCPRLLSPSPPFPGMGAAFQA